MVSTCGATGITVEAETSFVASEMLLGRKGTSTEDLGRKKWVLGQLEGLLDHIVGLRDQHEYPNNSWNPCWAQLEHLLLVQGSLGLQEWTLGHHGGLRCCSWPQNQ